MKKNKTTIDFSACTSTGVNNLTSTEPITYDAIVKQLETIQKQKDEHLSSLFYGMRVMEDEGLKPEQWYLTYKNEVICSSQIYKKVKEM